MSVIVCPGIHSSELTTGFLMGLQNQLSTVLTVPAERYPAYSPLHLLSFLYQHFNLPSDAVLSSISNAPSLTFIGFSAGVVGAIGAARRWRSQGGKVNALIAIDGWGVPLYADFPIHRVSHDYFTHWSSSLLGGNGESFYADPPVAHLDLWRSPHMATGYCVAQSTNLLIDKELIDKETTKQSSMTAAQFLLRLLTAYGETCS